MHIAIVILLLLTLVFGPNLWVRSVMYRHSKPRSDFPGTAGQLVEHLLNQSGMSSVSVESLDGPSHYDTEAKVIRLSSAIYDGTNLTSIVIAAHEFGHAVQDAQGYKMLNLRTKLASLIPIINRIGGILLLAAPVVAMATRAPHIVLIQITGGFAVLGCALVFHLVTLPVELDASFGKALPLLRNGKYIRDEDLPAARQLLIAAAFTYVAQSLVSLFNLFAWLRMVR